MPHYVTCIISIHGKEFFIHHKSYVNMSKSKYQYHSFHTPHVIQLPSNNTQKIPNLGPQFNEASSGLNIPNTHQKKKFFFFSEHCVSVAIKVSLSRQRTPSVLPRVWSRRAVGTCRVLGRARGKECRSLGQLASSPPPPPPPPPPPLSLGTTLQVKLQPARPGTRKINFLHSYGLSIQS